jgi:hypothetical protein
MKILTPEDEDIRRGERWGEGVPESIVVRPVGQSLHGEADQASVGDHSDDGEHGEDISPSPPILCNLWDGSLIHLHHDQESREQEGRESP